MRARRSLIVLAVVGSFASLPAAAAENAKAVSEKPAERPGMVYVPAGEFPMGSKADDPIVFDHEKHSEEPQHVVKLGAFYIDKTEVTNKDFEAVAEHFRDEHSPCDDCPVNNVSWVEARAYCNSKNKRLPTEAEWEKAAKGGTDDRPEPFDDYAWSSANSITRTQPVGKKKPNGYGAYDMLGNVREWTNDWFDPDYYQKSPKEDPKGPDTGQRKVERGGAFFLPKRSVTSTIRYNHPPTFRLYFLGFRCAQDP